MQDIMRKLLNIFQEHKTTLFSNIDIISSSFGAVIVGFDDDGAVDLEDEDEEEELEEGAIVLVFD
jgi:hypothetical protein